MYKLSKTKDDYLGVKFDVNPEYVDWNDFQQDIKFNARNLEDLETINIYVDGACKLLKGIGCAAYIITDLNDKILFKHSEVSYASDWNKVTNNTMEMESMINALKHLNKPMKINLYSDSEYAMSTLYSNAKTAKHNNGLISTLQSYKKKHQVYEQYENTTNKIFAAVDRLSKTYSNSFYRD